MARSLTGNKLTAKQAHFVAAYVNTKSVSKAATKVGCSRAQAHRYMSTMNVRREIRKALEDELIALRADPNSILAELARDAYVDPAEYFDENTGAVKPLNKMPPHVRRTIESIEVKVTKFPDDDDPLQVETVKIKRVSKHTALNMLAKNHALLVDRVEVEDNTDIGVMGKRQRQIEELYRRRQAEAQSIIEGESTEVETG